MVRSIEGRVQGFTPPQTAARRRRWLASLYSPCSAIDGQRITEMERADQGTCRGTGLARPLGLTACRYVLNDLRLNADLRGRQPPEITAAGRKRLTSNDSLVVFPIIEYYQEFGVAWFGPS